MLRMIKNIICLSLCAWILPVYANLPFFPLKFPRDDAAHVANVSYPINHLTEWWYFAGKIVTQQGRHYSYYLSINRFFDKSAQLDLPVLTFHVVDLDNKKVYATVVPYLSFTTQFDNAQLNISLKNDLQLWQSNGTFHLHVNLPLYHELETKQFDFSLVISPVNGRLLVNKIGMVTLWDNTNSYYYAYPRNRTEGYLAVDQQLDGIVKNLSNTYIDHQWGDFTVSDKHPWFWQHISLTNKMDIIGGMSVDPVTKKPDAGQIDIVFPDGKKFVTDKFSLTPGLIGDDHYPLTYQLTVPSLALKLTIRSRLSGQCVTGICEAMSDVSGQILHQHVSGYSIAETTVKY